MPPHHHHHPPHHHSYSHYHWEELPESAVQAATLLGYTSELWESSNHESTNYFSKSFEDLSNDEKRAATYLGWNPLDYKLNKVPFSQVSTTTQGYAKLLGWDEIKWNKNWPIHDIECYNLYWKDMNEKQKEALEYFGFNQNLWDRQGQEESFDGSSNTSTSTNNTTTASASNSDSKPSPPSPSKPTSTSSEEKKDDDSSDDNKQDDSTKTDDNDNKKKPHKKYTMPSGGGAKSFSQSEVYGGHGMFETKFDHGNHPHIDEIVIHADANRIHGIQMTYSSMANKPLVVGNVSSMENKRNAANHTVLKLRPGEFITKIKLHAKPNKFITSMTMYSNRGTSIVGGTSTQGTETIVTAPDDNHVLCGILGSVGKQHVNSLAFRWGPKPIVSNN